MEDLYKKYLVEPEDFIKIISKPIEELNNIRIIEGTNFPPLSPRNKLEEFKIKRNGDEGDEYGGLVIDDCTQSSIPNSQSTIPNPQSPIPNIWCF